MNSLLAVSLLLLSFDPAATDVSVGAGMWSGARAVMFSLELYHIPDDDVHISARMPLLHHSDGAVSLDTHWYRGPSGIAAAIEALSWEGRSGSVEAGLMWGTKRIIMEPGAHGMYLSVDGSVPRPVLELGLSSPWVDGSAWVEGIDIHEASGGEILVGPSVLRAGVRFAALGHDARHLSMDGVIRYSPAKWAVLGAGYRHSGAPGAVAWAMATGSRDSLSATVRLEAAAGGRGFIPFLTGPLSLLQTVHVTAWGAYFHSALTWNSFSVSGDLLYDTKLTGSLAAGWGRAGIFYVEGAVAFSDSGPVLASGSFRWLVRDPLFIWASGTATVTGQGPANTVMVGLGMRSYWFRP